MDSMGENINSYSAKKLTEEIMDHAFNLSNTWRVTEERDRLAIISGKAPKDIMLPRITVAATCIFLYNTSVLFSDMDTYFGLTYNDPGGCFGKYFADIMQSNSKYKPLHNFIQELYLPTIKKYGDSFPPFKNIISEFIFNPILCIDAMKACDEQDTALRAKFQIDYVKSRIFKPATPEQQTANTIKQPTKQVFANSFSAKMLTKEIVDYAFDLADTWRMDEEKYNLANGIVGIRVSARCIFLQIIFDFFKKIDTRYSLTDESPGGCFYKTMLEYIQSNTKYESDYTFLSTYYLPLLQKYALEEEMFKKIISEFTQHLILRKDALQGYEDQSLRLRAKFSISYIETSLNKGIKPSTPIQQTANTRQQEKSKSWLKTFIPGCVFAGIWILCAIGSVMRGTGLFGPHIQGTGLEVFFFNFGSFVGNNFALIIAAILFIISIKKKKSDN